MSDNVVETAGAPPARRVRTPWDAFRKVSAWAGLSEIVVVGILFAVIGGRISGSGGPDSAQSFAVIAVVAAPAILAGLVSGSRFFSLYSGYAERVDPTARLSEGDSAAGGQVVNGFIGDGLWGSLIAGLAAALPATIALSFVLGVGAVILLPLFALIGGMAWFAGWVVGAVSSMLVSAALGIAAGALQRRDRAHRLPLLLVAAFLPLVLVTVALPGATVRVNGAVDVFSAILFALGFPMPGAESLTGPVTVVLAGIAGWLAIVIFVALITIGTPALLRRTSGRG